MWRRGAHSDAAHRLPTADSCPAPVRRRRRPALTCRPSHLFFGLVVALCVASFLGVWELVPIGDGDAAAAAPPRPPTSSGGAMRFSPSRMALRAFDGESRLEAARSTGRWWPGLAPVRLALVVGTMDVDAQSLMLATLARSLTGLGYEVQVLAFADGEAHDIWMHICGHVHVMSSEGLKSVDWSRYNAILVSSLEGKRVISILMQETFQFLPVVWLIHEDFLGQHLRSYAELPLSMPSHVEDWRAHFNACAYVVFPDSYIPLLYSPLDTGNFLVIPGSPVDIWAAKRYGALHSQESLRNQHGIKEDDVVILVVGSYLFFDELPWDYAAVMRASAQQILEMARSRNFRVQFVFFCGNATDAYDSAFQELASHMAFPDGSVKHFSMTHDTKELFLLADIVLYGSLQLEPGFPPLLLRSMASEMPIIAPNLTIITKYVRDGIHGFLFDSDDPSTMATAFLRMLGGKKLSDSAYSVALEGKLLSKSMLAYDCITAHVKLLESVIHYPSDAKLPSSVSEIQERTWLWDLFEMKAALRNSSSENDSHIRRSIIDFLEGESPQSNRTASYDSNGTSYDYPSLSDWDDLSEAEIFEDIERREMQEIEERVEKPLLSWDEVYRNARKSERLKPEGNERDEGELERTGQPVCIYEVYIGEGAWSFLHHGSLYRGITLSKGGRRPRSDDVDAVSRLAVLDSPHYRDLLCEFGAMFAIANRVDTVHKLPWIGFQTWRAAGRKVALSKSAETTLEEAVAEENHEDVIYYWVPMDMDQHSDDKINLNFWSMCDCLNAGHCRTLFEDAFRTMYGLPEGVVALPPMPSDGDYWSTLHSWVMPTPSFLKFIMFSRMFVDSLHRLNQNRNQNSSGPASCLLGASQPEKRHCYCRILEVLVNVWAYHSGRKMVYLNPVTGGVKEQHPREERREMWVKFFNYTLLKSMDEDLAEEADDGMHPEQDQWLWPLTGQVFWPGMADREREEKYIRKMDKKIKSKVKLLERQKSGYKQKPLGQGQ